MECWVQGPYNAALQVQLHTPQTVYVEEQRWQQRVAAVLFPSDPALPGAMLDFARGTLAEVAATDLPARLHGKQLDEELKPLRLYRKLTMIGRDTVRLTTRNTPERRESLEPLHILCHQLGLITDTAGQKPCYIKHALSAFKQLDDVLDSLENFRPQSSKTIRHKAQAHIPHRQFNQARRQRDADRYHDARIDLRRVAHAGLVSYLVAPNEEKLRYAATGFRLNTHYGNQHNKLIKRQQRKVS